jgi:hypothetical protein
METEVSLPRSQEPASSSYPEPDKSSPHPFRHPPIYAKISQIMSSLKVFRIKFWARFSSHTCYMPFPTHLFYDPNKRTTLGPTQLPVQLEPGALSLGVKRPGRQADNSPPSGVPRLRTRRASLIGLHGVVLSQVKVPVRGVLLC